MAPLEAFPLRVVPEEVLGRGWVLVRVAVSRRMDRRIGSRATARRSRRSCGSRTPKAEEGDRRWRGLGRSTTVTREARSDGLLGRKSAKPEEAAALPLLADAGYASLAPAVYK